MISRVRRQAIWLTAGMGVASVLGAFARPTHRPDDAPRLDLEHLFPTRFGEWKTDSAAAAFVGPAAERNYKIYEQVLERTFVNEHGQRVMLSVAYGREQSSGLELHWPEVCYHYGGFAVRGRHLAYAQTDSTSLQVTRLVADMPGRPEPITYWTVIGGELVADRSTFRLQSLSHAVRGEVVDGLLVRVSSIDPDDARAFALHAAFIGDLVRAVAPADRSKVIGRPSRSEPGR